MSKTRLASHPAKNQAEAANHRQTLHPTGWSRRPGSGTRLLQALLGSLSPALLQDTPRPFQLLLHKLSHRLPRNKRIGSLLTAPGWGGGLWDDLWVPLMQFSPTPTMPLLKHPPAPASCPVRCPRVS
ncbi:unnamed protein product [Rangifer tarandus platyrhynchus]|uniref:Uncharacterized protein n=1 Tax=Rangifer tarandus platyrhynchus TaxID=3082113 RepID=A0ABN8ZIA7_RANTA|nr:unnamed protein product [Rangifer tarandus platyrhynchus]